MIFLQQASILLAILFFVAPSASATTGESSECLPFNLIPSQIVNAPFLVFGEVHGTEEVPQFVNSYLCAASGSARKVTLAIEIPTTEQRGIDAFLASPGEKRDIDRFLSSPFWQRDFQDGRSSIAMFRFFERIRLMRMGGAQIQVVAIDESGKSVNREAAMSSNIKAELDRNTDGQVVALIGGLHAIRIKGNRFNPKYESAIYLLAGRRPLTLTVGTLGGTAWICKSNYSESCQVTAWDINRVDPTPSTLISLSPPSEQFDGVFFVGRTTASPPAIRQLKGSVGTTTQ